MALFYFKIQVDVDY